MGKQDDGERRLDRIAGLGEAEPSCLLLLRVRGRVLGVVQQHQGPGVVAGAGGAGRGPAAPGSFLGAQDSGVCVSPPCSQDGRLA